MGDLDGYYIRDCHTRNESESFTGECNYLYLYCEGAHAKQTTLFCVGDLNDYIRLPCAKRVGKFLRVMMILILIHIYYLFHIHIHIILS